VSKGKLSGSTSLGSGSLKRSSSSPSNDLLFQSPLWIQKAGFKLTIAIVKQVDEWLVGRRTLLPNNLLAETTAHKSIATAATKKIIAHVIIEKKTAH
jgi:hypothetical protein